MDRLNEKLLDGLRQAIAILSLDGTVLFVNSEVKKLFGRSKQEVLGKRYDEAWYDKQTNTFVQSKIQECVKNGHAKILNCKINTYQGEQICTDIFYNLVKDFETHGDVVVCIIRDNTSINKKQEQLQEAQNELVDQSVVLDEILKQTNQGIAVADAHGNLIHFNQAAKSILGVGATDQGSETWSEVYGVFELDKKTPVKEQNLPLVRAIKGETVNNIHFWINNPSLEDGCFITVSANPIYDQNQKQIGAVAFFQDITKQKIKNQDVERTKKFLDLIIENIPHYIYVKDAKNLQYVQVNKATENLFGVKRKGLIGKTVYDFFPKKEADFFVEADKHVIESKQTYSFPEESNQTPAGKRILRTKKIPIVDQENNTEFILGISEDVTEQFNASKKIQELEIEHKTLFEVANDAIITFDFVKNCIVEVNNTAKKMLGFSDEEFKSMKSPFMIDPDINNDLSHPHHTWKKQLDEKGSFTVESCWIKKDGSKVPVQVSAKPYEVNGKTYFKMVGHNLSEKKKIEQEKAMLTQKIKEYADSMNAKSFTPKGSFLMVQDVDQYNKSIKNIIEKNTNRPTIYVTLTKTQDAIKSDLQRQNISTDQIFFIEYLNSDAGSKGLRIPLGSLKYLFEAINECISEITPPPLLIINSVTLFLLNHQEASLEHFFSQILSKSQSLGVETYVFCTQRNEFIDKISNLFEHFSFNDNGMQVEEQAMTGPSQN